MSRRWCVVSAVLIALAGASVVGAQDPKKIDQTPRTVSYSAREKKAPKEIQERLGALRAEIKTKGLGFRVGYTTAMDEPLERLAGARMPQDLATRAPEQNRLAAELRRLDLEALSELRRIQPKFRFPELQLKCSANLSSFSWRARRKVTPVRNQDGCGSCWAFATIGAFEGNYAIRNGQLIDSSEQEVLSCSGAGSCGGGWWAFDYLISDGVSRETVYPYTATDTACNTSVAHPYRATVWGYVRSDGGTPTVSEMKQALCEHGPLAVAVWVSPAFQAYSAGVFDEKVVDKGINHGVTLVGWNDAEQAWLIKNSWGAGWGESGYMRIKYDSNRIGAGAAWVTARNRFYLLPKKYFELMPRIKPFPEPDPLPR